ncbi:MAG: hypothetical protein ACHQXG_10255 [Nitrososphaerales archaeon]
MDEILSDLAALIIQFKDLPDKKIIEEKILERIVTIYEHLQTAVVNSRLEDDRLGKQYGSGFLISIGQYFKVIALELAY